MLDKFTIWLYERLQERSTQTALVGLLPFIFKYSHIPEDMINPLINVIAAFLFSVTVTKG